MADSQKTEQATPRKIEQARKDGRFITSREAVGAVQFLALAWMLASWCSSYCSHFLETSRYLLRGAFTTELTVAETMRLLHLVLVKCFGPLALAGAALMAISLAVQFGVTRLGVSFKGLTPNINRLNPINRIKELPKQNIPSLMQAVVLLPFFGFALWGVMRDNWDALMLMPLQNVEDGARQMGASLQSLLWKGAGAFILLGAIDYVRQSRRYAKDLRMSKYEVRQEAKEMEGNPQIRGRIRQLRREWLRRRMMSQVPKATAVVVNPTHYAVAIKYSMESMTAPVVLAKGKNYLALRIRKKAVECQIPVIENPPLAQALYKTAEVGQEIPAHLYRAVAEILAYIYKIMGGRLPA